MGRPVGVVVDQKADILVADDVGGMVWRVSPSSRIPVTHTSALIQR
jgi:glucose/arabinose dehydrogenase